MNSNGFGSRNIPDGNSMRSQMDPQSLKAVKKLQEVSKDRNLDHTTKQRKVFEIIKETPNVRQFLEWIEREKGKNAKGNQQRGTMGNMGSNDMGSLQSQGVPQGGGMIGNNCDPQAKTNSILPNNDPSMNGGGNIGSVHEFSPVPSGIQPGSPMSMNGSFSGSVMGQDMEKPLMQQWDMKQQPFGGVITGNPGQTMSFMNTRLQNPGNIHPSRLQRIQQLQAELEREYQMASQVQDAQLVTSMERLGLVTGPETMVMGQNRMINAQSMQQQGPGGLRQVDNLFYAKQLYN